MYHRLRIWIILSILFLYPQLGPGQAVTCIENYGRALDYYAKGNIDSAYELTVPCIEDRSAMRSLSRYDRRNIFWLAAQASYFLNDHEKGDLFTRELLTIDPYYNIRRDDILEFKHCIEQSVVIPRHQIGLRLGYFQFHPVVVRHFSLFTPMVDFYFDMVNGVNIGLMYEYNLFPWMTVGTELNLRNGIYMSTVGGSQLYVKGFWKGVFGSNERNINYIQLPLYLDYNFLSGRNVSPYVEIGCLFNFLYQTAFPSYYVREWNNYHKTYKYYIIKDSFDYTAFFFENPLHINFFTGIGIMARLKAKNLKFNFRYVPTLIRQDPFEQIPEGFGPYDWYADGILDVFDEIFLMRFTNNIQLSLAISFNLGYKVY